MEYENTKVLSLCPEYSERLYSMIQLPYIYSLCSSTLKANTLWGGPPINLAHGQSDGQNGPSEGRR